MPLTYHTFYPIGIFFSWIAHIWGRWEVRGKENVPKKGPLIVVANHVNLIDIPLMAVSLGRKVIFMAKEELFHSKFVGHFLRSFGSFPVRRGRPDRKALRQAQQLLADGGALIIFPEGKRSKNAQLQPAFFGAALLAQWNGTPILPVGIIGTEQITGFASILRRPKVVINIGQPFYLPKVNAESSKAELAELTELIMKNLAELLPPEYRGDYIDKETGQGENRKGE